METNSDSTGKSTKSTGCPQQDSSDETKSNTSEQWLCPKGHVMDFESAQYEGGTCDICRCSLPIADEYLVCLDCSKGFAVCQDCISNYANQPEYITSVNHYSAGNTFLDQGNYSCAVEELKKSFNLREVLTTKNPTLGSSVSALGAETLAKAQYLVGDIDTALQTCATASSYYEASGEDWEDEAALAQKLLEGMKIKSQWIGEGMENIGEEAIFSGISYSSHELKLPGVSVYHLQTTFVARVRVANLNENSSIHEIENLQGLPGVIRKRGIDVVCPIDGKKGAAYVNCLEGVDHVGEATHMLSYSWSYKIRDIVDSLTDYCMTKNLNPKRTYIWIDCLCINQHRVVEQKKIGGTGMLNFEEEFPNTLKKIGHMLAVMAPWKAPIYLTRLWCVFEMYAAHANGCMVDIVMPVQEKESLEQNVIEGGGGINALYGALGNTNVQNADATVKSDKEVIMGMIESTVGCRLLNNEVNKLLRGWMKQALLQLVEKRDDANDERYATNCSSVGGILWKNGEYDGALEQYWKCLAIREATQGTDHPDTAETYNDIGLVLYNKGDYDGALEEYRKCLAIQEVELGSDHPETAITYNNLGNVLNSKGDYDGALEFLKKCLAVEEAVLGADHPNTATTYSNIGNVLVDQGDFDGAIEEFWKCLVIREAALGKDHPETAIAYNNIGVALENQGDYDGALKQYRKCLPIQEVVLGGDHPDTAITYSNIGNVLVDQGDFDGALEQYRKCLAIQEAALGSEHPNTATTCKTLGLVLNNKGDYDGALEFFKKCLAIEEVVLGADHPNTAITHRNIGSALGGKGKYDAALKEFKKSLFISEKKLGKDHPETENLLEWIDHLSSC